MVRAETINLKSEDIRLCTCSGVQMGTEQWPNDELHGKAGGTQRETWSSATTYSRESYTNSCGTEPEAPG